MKLSASLVLAFVVMSYGQSLETYIVRLPPTAFPELPANLVQDLQRRQCTIPQEAFSNGRSMKGAVKRKVFPPTGRADEKPIVTASPASVETICCSSLTMFR